MEKLKEQLLSKEHWEETYNKMVLKQGFSKEDKDLLWQLKEVDREDIVKEIESGNYVWSIPRKVEIAKSESKKKRVVYIYNTKDRYILGVLYRAVSKYYYNTLNDKCFSYKKEVGTHTAIRYIKENKNENFKYGVKVDIHSYFNSVSKERVSEMINELFCGGIKKTVEKLMLTDKVIYKNKVIDEYKSLIPGCAFGSFFANYCLLPCDKYFENTDVIYARYSDDIIILTDTKEKLQNYLNIVLEYISNYGLTINPDKYTWFEPGDSVEFLGLKLCKDDKVDISDHAKQKIKKQIHRWCRKGRMEIERDYKNFYTVARRIVRKINNKNLFCAIDNETTFGWAMYAFSKITTIQSLVEIDNYTIDTLQAMKTGKHNKRNYGAISKEELKELGYLSLVDMYKLYKYDLDYYMEVVEIHKHLR